MQDAAALGLAPALPAGALELGVSVYGRGERNCAVMSDAGAVVRFVRERRSEVGVRSA
jgi:GH18 family chitinase